MGVRLAQCRHDLGLKWPKSSDSLRDLQPCQWLIKETYHRGVFEELPSAVLGELGKQATTPRLIAPLESRHQAIARIFFVVGTEPHRKFSTSTIGLDNIRGITASHFENDEKMKR
jgi:hypothetical protein